MPRRSPSPAPSENEIDIFGSLVDNQDSDNERSEARAKPNDFDLDFGDILRAGNDEDGSDDDDAFIASALRRSNRKSSNLQGKTVKKGGGFQAMGMLSTLFRCIIVCQNSNLRLPRPRQEAASSYR